VTAAEPDLVVRGGTVYDGSGTAPRRADVGVTRGRIAAVGSVPGRAALEIDATGLAVAPGFINMLSHAWASLIQDGRSQSDIRQGVTLEVFGEYIEAPLNERLRAECLRRQGDFKYDITWSTVGEYLDQLVGRGISTNVASFIPASVVRRHVVGEDDRRPTADELARMCELVDVAMREGALGIASALIYTPATFADTDELAALATASAKHGGMYVSHMRSEGDRFIEALDELIEIARRSRGRAEVYHLKQAGRDNWGKLDIAIERIEAARASGTHVTADMYTYSAGATGLDASLPPWVQEGGHRKFVERLRDATVRARLVEEMRRPGVGWENMLLLAGTPEGVLFSSFKNVALRRYTGWTLAQVAAERQRSPEDTIIDLVIEDDSRVGAIYFVMADDNVRRQVALPWMSFASDSASLAPEGLFLKENPHPRAYGTFARLLGRYVRDEKVIPLEEAIRKMTSLPAENLRIEGRGRLAPGYAADVVVFDPARIQDHATYERPHQYATGVHHVVVNGVPVISDGEHTGARPGQVVRGPGWRA
jgi:N-acyl-D-amino-acid deacylase